MHTVKINTLSQFLNFSGLLLVSNLMGFILRKIVGRVCSNTLPPARQLTPMPVNILYKNCVYNSLPEDEPLRFETYRRRQKLKN